MSEATGITFLRAGTTSVPVHKGTVTNSAFLYKFMLIYDFQNLNFVKGYVRMRCIIFKRTAGGATYDCTD